MGFGLSTDWAEREKAFPVPHPPVSLAVFLTLEDAIATAWQILHANPPRSFLPDAALETDFTTHLHEILEDHLLDSGAVAGFTSEVFSKVFRPEVRNFDGQKTSKKPDMVVCLSDRPNVKRSQDGIFIECKPVDRAHSLLSDYCEAGVARFVVGDYAWAMTEALMVGYNTAHPKPSIALSKPLQQRATLVQASQSPRDCQVSPHRPAVAKTEHKRSFRVNGQRVPNITLRHLWLAAPARQ